MALGGACMIIRISVCLLIGMHHMIVSGSCEAGWHEHNNHCYKMFGQAAPLPSAAYARSSCKTHGADLATVTSSQEQQFVLSLKQNDPQQTATEVYIGLTDTLKEGTYVWLDGSAIGYSNWQFAEPNNYPGFGGENCASILLTYFNFGKWNDVPCLHNPRNINGFLCEKHMQTATDGNNIIFTWSSGRYCIGHTILEISVTARFWCLQECLINTQCLSVSYKSGGAAGEMNCVLNSATSFEARGAITTDNTLAGVNTSQWDYHEIIHPGV